MSQMFWLHEAFQALDFGHVPDRRQLRAAFSTSPIPETVRLVLLFGSAARGEAASDIDIVVLVEQGQEPFHEYERLHLNGIALDLNVVDTEWIDRATLDLEQSYWLSESYPVYTESEVWLARWADAANAYWTIEAIKRRRGQFSALIQNYADASRSASRLGLERASRLAAHEAARAYVCDLMDQDGLATHSHGLVARNLQQGGLENVPPQLRAHLVKSLSKAPLSTGNYLAVRRAVSGFRRAPSTLKVMGLDSLHSHSIAAVAFSQILTVRGAEIEALLSHSDLDNALPSEFPSQLTDSVAYASQAPYYKRRNIQELSIPAQGAILGARWVERTADRLKVIVNTGGCKTPTCKFCSLPQFARRLPRCEPAEVVRAALSLHEVAGLSLYNDGNFLNEAEISVKDRKLLCNAILERRIRSLTIESVPRFVTEGKLREVQAWSGVSELVVAMGLQTAGNLTAARLLGRPDVNALFSFAIDEIHAAGAIVRLYLLHGYGRDFAFWDQCLVESIEWAGARSVERVSICPYVDPSGAPIDKAHVAHLEAVIRTLPVAEGMNLELVGRGLTSCGTGGHRGN